MPAPPPSESVRVVVQARPLLPFESLHGARQAVDVSDLGHVHVSRPLVEDMVFSEFDAVYMAQTGGKPHVLYEQHVQPLVEGLFDGLNATVFAYGQTSAGKSYTMTYITRRVAEKVFELKRAVEKENGGRSVTVRVGFVEIYRERIRDLVDGARNALGVVNVQVRERKGKGVFLDGAKEKIVAAERDLMDIVREGGLVRQTASTGMNASSSRSHSVITMTVQIEGAKEGQCLTGKLHLVDLAGSERAKRTAVQGERFAEGVTINKGLFSLAKCINALADSGGKGGRHIPYRDSKLTRLLQDSLGGNARTLLVACVSPADTSREETLGTLRYAERAKCIKNRPKVNTEKDSVEVSDLRAALARARAEISSLAAENERLRRGTGTRRNFDSMETRRQSLSSGSCSEGSPTSFIDSDGNMSSENIPEHSSFVAMREDDEVSGLKCRIQFLEGLLEHANLTATEKEIVLGQGEDKVSSCSPLRKLKNVGLQAFSHTEGTDLNGGKRKAGSKIANKPRRRVRAAAQRVEAGVGLTKNSKMTGRIRSGTFEGALERRSSSSGGEGLATRSASVNAFPKRTLKAQRVDSVNGSPSMSNATSEEKMDGDFEIDLGLEDGVSAEDVEKAMAQIGEMRRSFLHRLKQVELDKNEMESKRIDAMRKLGANQKEHEKQMEDLKSGFNSRLADMRMKVGDFKRLEEDRTRQMKMRDASDAMRKKLATKLKKIERERDEGNSKLAETCAKLEMVKRSMSRETKQLGKMERNLRMELRKCQVGKSGLETVVKRLRMENEGMKIKLRNYNGRGTDQVRRIKSSAVPATATKHAPAAC